MNPEEAARAAAAWSYVLVLAGISSLLGLAQRIDTKRGLAWRARGEVIKEMARTAAWFHPAAGARAQRLIDEIDAENDRGQGTPGASN